MSYLLLIMCDIISNSHSHTFTQTRGTLVRHKRRDLRLFESSFDGQIKRVVNEEADSQLLLCVLCPSVKNRFRSQFPKRDFLQRQCIECYSLLTHISNHLVFLLTFGVCDLTRWMCVTCRLAANRDCKMI